MIRIVPILLAGVACFSLGSSVVAELADVIGNVQDKRAAGVIMPGLDRIDPVPVRAFSARQQEIDRGGERASAAIDARIAKGFAIMPAFGMRL